MAVNINDVQSLMPKIIQIVNRKITDATALPDRTVSLIKKGTPKPANAKGAREILEVNYNTQVGSTGEDGVFLTGGGGKSVELLIGTVPIHISGKVTGKQIRNAKSATAVGGKVGELMMKDFKVLRMHDNINFCKGDGLFSRGKIASISVSGGNTTVTFDSVDGAYFIQVGATYFTHHPSTFALKGGGAQFQCISKTKTTAVFTGDMSAATTAAANDLLCPVGTADGESTINRAVRGFSYFQGTTGDYFGCDRDTIEPARGLRINAGSELVSHPLLESGQSVFFYRWGADATEVRHTDFVAPAQREAYKLNGYALRRIDGDSYKNYDGAIEKVTDGQRMMVVDPHLNDTVWERQNMDDIDEYRLQEMAVWDLDGLQMRTVTASGSVRDSVGWVIFGENQYANRNPAQSIEFYNLSTAGVATKTT